MSEHSKFQNSKFNSILLKHILAWSLYILYELVFLYLMTGTISNPEIYTVNYTLNIALFYFNAHVLLDFSVEKWRLKWYVIPLLIIVEIGVFVAIKYPINLFLLGEQILLKTKEEFRMYAVSNIIRSIYYVGFSTAYWFALLTFRRNRKISELETQKLIQQNEKILLQKDLLQSRNAYLQAQVNPHLLFNTLNFMYNASLKVSEKLAESVMTLSDIMRYALHNIEEDDKVPLEQEINHINNYIKLNQIRYDEKLNIDFHLTGETSELRIIPLALITLVENVFKYGDLLNPQQPAKINMTIKNRNLELELFNKKRTNRRVLGHGTGIANLKERLDIYYPDAYTMDINDMENTYALKLNITLNE